MFTVLIPARYASTRLPGKPLLDIAGKPMVVRVAERARASGAARVVVATDDERIRAAVADHGIEVLMTRSSHPTGTDRLAEAAAQLGLDDEAIVVNVQGDEPLLEPELIHTVADTLIAHADAAIATACHPIDDPAEAFNPNVVKVVLDRNDPLLGVGWIGDDAKRIPPGMPLYRHYGLYAYRVAFLRHFPSLSPATIERFEALEQLRALWHGHRIIVSITRGAPAPGVDTEEDLERVRACFVGTRAAPV